MKHDLLKEMLYRIFVEECKKTMTHKAFIKHVKAIGYEYIDLEEDKGIGLYAFYYTFKKKEIILDIIAVNEVPVFSYYDYEEKCQWIFLENEKYFISYDTKTPCKPNKIIFKIGESK